jgi:hypothetical protein
MAFSIQASISGGSSRRSEVAGANLASVTRINTSGRYGASNGTLPVNIS